MRLICLALLFLSLCLSCLSFCPVFLSFSALRRYTPHTQDLDIHWFDSGTLTSRPCASCQIQEPSQAFYSPMAGFKHLIYSSSPPSFLLSNVHSHPLSLSLSFLSLDLPPLPFGGGYIRYNQFNFMQPGQTPRGHKYTHFLIHSTPGKAHPLQPRAALGPLALNY